MKLKLSNKAIRRIAKGVSIDVIIDQLNEYASDPSQGFMLSSFAKEVAPLFRGSERIEELDPYARMAIEHYLEE